MLLAINGRAICLIPREGSNSIRARSRFMRLTNAVAPVYTVRARSMSRWWIIGRCCLFSRSDRNRSRHPGFHHSTNSTFVDQLSPVVHALPYCSRQRARSPAWPSLSSWSAEERSRRPCVLRSVAEVADEVGVSTASIYFWETDRVRPRDANLSALCKVLRLPIRAARGMAPA